ncbi:hypothetical protein K523DRAFT_321744 [Schizophyllum commune Tattone D]|nr:hypothetical protein K525DRAFT_234077 [Schizophyllum commune Loenen D]KAI5827961.1 hypothetical protein K523DRAFT_321744 [Schizophyllum commune Tattone D]
MGLWSHLLRVLSTVHGRLVPAATKEEPIHVIDTSPLKQVRIVEHYNEYYSPRVGEKTPSPASAMAPLPPSQQPVASSSTNPAAHMPMPTHEHVTTAQSLPPPMHIPSGNAPRPRKRKRSNSATVHRLLAPGSPLHFNLRAQRPSVTTSRSHGDMSTDLLYEPATAPALPNLTVVVPGTPWALPITASNASYVNVMDVLSALHSGLRYGVTSDEYYGLPTREERDAVAAAYAARCDRVPEADRDEERKKGIKRIDFLTSHYRFRGLDYSHQGAGVFTLHVQQAR